MVSWFQVSHTHTMQHSSIFRKEKARFPSNPRYLATSFLVPFLCPNVSITAVKSSGTGSCTVA